MPQPAPLLFIIDPCCPGRPWQIMCLGKRHVRPRESHSALALARNSGGRIPASQQPWEEQSALLCMPMQKSSAISGTFVILVNFSSPVCQNQATSGYKWQYQGQSVSKSLSSQCLRETDNVCSSGFSVGIPRTDPKEEDGVR